jgi:hypothetical protein
MEFVFMSLLLFVKFKQTLVELIDQFVRLVQLVRVVIQVVGCGVLHDG